MNWERKTEAHQDRVLFNTSEVAVLPLFESKEIKYAKAGTPVEGVVDQIRGNTQTFINRNLRNSPVRVEWIKRLDWIARSLEFPVVTLTAAIFSTIIVQLLNKFATSFFISAFGSGGPALAALLGTALPWVVGAAIVVSLVGFVATTLLRSNLFSSAEHETAFPRTKHHYRKPGQTSTLEEEKKK